MDAIQRATKSLTRFLKDETQRVFALKGPWGVGKSYFIREVYLKGHKSNLPEYISFASLFGVRTIQEVREVINGCLESVRHPAVASFGRKMHEFLKIRVPLPGASIEVSDITTRVFWYLAKRHGVLIVLDDLERTHPDLDLDQILGLASSLTENSKAKILLILNEKEFDQQQAETIRRYREKVIDVEHIFRPEARDLVSRHLPFTDLVEVVIKCLEVKGGTNIRIIKKIERAVSYFRETAGICGLRHSANDLAQLARIVWLFYESPIPLTAELVSKAWLRNFWGETDENGASVEEAELYRLAGKVELGSGQCNELILEYLTNGYIPDESLQQAVRLQEDAHTKEQIDGRIKEALKPLFYDFHLPEEEATAPLKRVLDDFAERLSFEQIHGYTGLLGKFGVPTAQWWRRHVKVAAPKLNPREAHKYLAILVDAEAKVIVEQAISTKDHSLEPKASLLWMANERHWVEDYAEQLNTVDDDTLLGWIKDGDAEFNAAVRFALEQPWDCHISPINRRFYDKLNIILDKISAESFINCFRVNSLRAGLRPFATNVTSEDAAAESVVI